MWGHFVDRESSTETGLCNETTIPSTAANLRQNGWKRKESKRCSGPVKPKMLWWDFKRVVHEQMPPKLNELKQRCEEERAKVHLQWCERLMTSFRKVITSNYWCKRWFYKPLNRGVYTSSFPFYSLCTCLHLIRTHLHAQRLIWAYWARTPNTIRGSAASHQHNVNETEERKRAFVAIKTQNSSAQRVTRKHNLGPSWETCRHTPPQLLALPLNRDRCERPCRHTHRHSKDNSAHNGSGNSYKDNLMSKKMNVQLYEVGVMT